MPGLLVVRASDGAAFNLYRHDLEYITTLEDLRNKLLSPLLSIPPECLICMNEEGGQLREESVQHLAMLAGDLPETSNSSFSLRNGITKGKGKAIVRNSSPNSILRYNKEGELITSGIEVEKERRLYVYDRDHLDADPEQVADSLAITEDQLLTEPELQPQDPLPSHVALSNHNLEALRALIHSISLQRSSLQLAISNLSRVLASNSASFSIFQESTSPNLKAWESLLDGWQSSMDAISKVPVVDGLLTRANGGTGNSVREVSSTVTRKWLGDYVSSDKMSVVKDGCARILADLKGRSDELKDILDTVLDGTTTLEAEFSDTSRELEDLEVCENDANASHLRIEELVHAAQDFSQDSQHRAECFEELLGIDAESRDRIRFLVERKNAMTRYLILTMQRISILQSEISIMPVNLVSLDEDTKTKTDNFKHLARLEGLIPAYVATLVEIVRRRSFASHLQSHAFTVTESLSHLSTIEQTRRDDYKIKYSGKLPWEVKGLGSANDQSIPKFVLEGEGGKGLEELPNLGRDTLDEIKDTFTELLEGSSNDALRGNSPIVKAREMLESLIGLLDTLEIDFQEVALGNSGSNVARAEFESKIEELEKQIRLHEETNEDLERQLQTERIGREEELVQLYQRNSELLAAMDNDEMVLKENQTIILDLQHEVSRNELEKSNWEKERSILERERKETRRALEEEFAGKAQVENALRESKLRIEELQIQLSLAETSTGELTRQLIESDNQHSALQSDHSELQREFLGFKSTLGSLEDQLRNTELAHRATSNLVSEKDRILRDLRSESELEKAILEKEVSELKELQSNKDSDAKNASARNSTLEGIADGLREQVARWEKLLITNKGELELVKKDLEVAQKEVEVIKEEKGKEVAKIEGIARTAIKLVGDLRDENNKITAVLLAPIISKSGSSSDNPAEQTGINVANSSLDLISTSPENPISTSTTIELDYSTGDLEQLLEDVKNYDRDALTFAVKAKVESLTIITKKWSKEAKNYRERASKATNAASEKIAFRNFVKGDLVLFLPTRNSAVPVWAGFNVSFPHHFLSATGPIIEQMKTREWIVARITTITERVVDAKDPSTNPYLLPAGTRYYLLEVESWNNKDSSRSRKHSSSGRVEQRRSSSTGQIPSSATAAIAAMALSNTSPAVAQSITTIDSATKTTPSLRRSVSEMLPSNATDLAKSEFAIIEEESRSAPPSPTSLNQPVPRSNEPFGTPPSNSHPSALALSLARSVPNDPFSSSGPFSTSLPKDSKMMVGNSIISFEQHDLGVGIDPAFLPSKKSSIAGSSSIISGLSLTSPTNPTTIAAATAIPAPRYIRPSSRVSSNSGQQQPVDLAVSPASTSGSHAGFYSKSPGSTSASSILSSRPIPGGFPRNSSNNSNSNTNNSNSTTGDKAQATLEAQEGSSRWNSLTEDLVNKDDLSKRGKVMTIGRNSKGWPITRGTSGLPVEVEGSVSWGASSIIAKLKGGSGGTTPSSK